MKKFANEWVRLKESSEIEEKVMNEEVDGGLIIHENRFTYQEKGLEKVMDLVVYLFGRLNALVLFWGDFSNAVQEVVHEKPNVSTPEYRHEYLWCWGRYINIYI